MRRLAILSLLAFPMMLSCFQNLPDHVDLQPAAEQVELATEAPSQDTFVLVGAVTGQAAANDPEVAQDAAKNDLRNHAAALGANLVTVDDSVGSALLLQDKTRVVVYGRAYKSLD
ncbi:MAG: DUF4156 domain-containing protein [Polyangiaceae bacterium]